MSYSCVGYYPYTNDIALLLLLGVDEKANKEMYAHSANDVSIKHKDVLCFDTYTYLTYFQVS